MEGQFNNPHQSQTQDSNDDAQVGGEWTAEALDRCAQLIAADEMQWPPDLSDEQESQLLSAVRRYRRAMLIKFIAARIAADIVQDGKKETTETEP